jgi:hypothetical protein
MSALLLKADIRNRHRHVRFVPKADILHCSKERRYSITLSASASRLGALIRAARPFVGHPLAVPSRQVDETAATL